LGGAAAAGTGGLGFGGGAAATEAGLGLAVAEDGVIPGVDADADGGFEEAVPLLLLRAVKAEMGRESSSLSDSLLLLLSLLLPLVMSLPCR